MRILKITISFIFSICLSSLTWIPGLSAISLARESDAPRSGIPYEVYNVKAISNVKILPYTFPIPGVLANELKITACRGEYEPATLVVRALQNLKGLRLTVSDFHHGEASIPASAIDIRVVKCWFQSGVEIRGTQKCLLTPELLLKDDKLIRVDLKNKRNYLRQINPAGEESYLLLSGPDSGHLDAIQPKDSDVLQPVDIEAGANKQFWITVKVPEDAIPGNYQGKILLTAPDIPPKKLILHLRVLPFSLENPVLRYSLYYLGKLRKDGRGSITADFKSVQQYLAELHNLKVHGVDYPTLSAFDEDLFQQALALREKLGFPKDSLYINYPGIDNPTGPKQLAALKDRVKKSINIAEKYHYKEVYFYGFDEAEGERLKSQRRAWQTVHEAGGRVFVACYKGAFELMGDLLDLAVLSGPPDPGEAEKFHTVGHQIFCYGNPQAGVEEPETYRRNYGLLLWQARYDGSMNFAYQWSYKGHIWNDFDNDTWRDHCFTYPTVNGVIDTIQWEGFREGVDDVRYLTTLLRTIQRAKTHKPQLSQQAQEWVDKIDPKGDLDLLRGKIVEWILQLQLPIS